MNQSQFCFHCREGSALYYQSAHPDAQKHFWETSSWTNQRKPEWKLQPKHFISQQNNEFRKNQSPENIFVSDQARQCHRLSICTCQEIWYEGATNTATHLTWQIERRLPQPSVSVCRIFEWLGNFQKVTYQQNFDRLALLRTYNFTSVWFQSISSTFGGAGTTFVNSLLADWPGLVVSGEIFLPKWYCICPAHDICICSIVRQGGQWGHGG